MDRSLLAKAPCCYNCLNFREERHPISSEIRFYYCSILHRNSAGWDMVDDEAKVNVDNLCPFYEGSAWEK